jgi:hypothetical protein
MGRGGSRAKTTLTTSEARSVLPKLARTAARRTRPSKSLLDNAVEIQPRGEKRSAYLVPEVDIEKASLRIEELEDELEDVALMRLLEQRALADSGNLTPVDDVIRELGFEDLLDEAVR